MNKVRKGEKRTLPFRSQRLFTIGHEWYFTTREACDQGPFMTRWLAEQAIVLYVKRYQPRNEWKMLKASKS